jgi:hypothetical protein
VGSGGSWQTLVIVSGVAVATLALAYLAVPMPSGRRTTTVPVDPTASGGIGRLLAGPLLLLGIAIATYVASELGVSSWAGGSGPESMGPSPVLQRACPA